MSYQPTIPSLVSEISVYLVFLLACCNAVGQGRRWLFTVIGGTLAGFFAEVAIVHLPNPRYSYGTHLFILNWLDVPLMIGFGWGMIFYAATWTAQRLGLRLVASSLVAGTLGVNLDLSLDPLANHHKFWVWHERANPFPNAELFGVPFDNFVAWVVLIGTYGLIVRYAFRLVNRHVYGARAATAANGLPANGLPPNPSGPPGAAAMEAKGNVWFDVLVPPGSALVAGGLFVLVRSQADRFYLLVGNQNPVVGEALVFAVLFGVGTYAFWCHMFGATRNQEVNWVVIGIAAYIHVLSLFLFVWEVFAGDVSKIAPMGFIIPMNLVAGLLAFAWPSLDTLMQRFAKAPTGPNLPQIILKTLSSYAGVKVRAYVWAPADEAELKVMLEFARNRKLRITFRTGGQSFDTQSLNDQIVISLEKFTSIAVNETARSVTVGCGATWGAILKKTLPQGLVPYVMVTNSIATAGGTLSSNCLARFSPTCGREGGHVESFKLFTPDGDVLLCSRKLNAELFGAVIGGLGYVGAVLEITYRLFALPEKDAVVETTFTRVEGLDKIRANLDSAPRSARFGKFVHELSDGTHRCLAQGNGGSSVNAACVTPVPEAVSAVVYLRGGAWGLIARSRYVPKTKLKPSVFHSPNSVLHFVLQLFATIPVLRRLGYLVTFRLAYTGTTTNYDEAFGYTFFEDGNRRLRRFLHAIGVPCRILQQTFILPAKIGASGVDSSALTAFLEKSDALLDAKGLEPALIDVLYIGADKDKFLLSSSNGLDGFAVTFTFERLFRSIDDERAALVEMSNLCNEYGGRVHLVKNVCADKELIGKMYATGISALSAVRKPRQAQALLLNDFSNRVLPGI
jgi:decaprenylphospho-beta-D-ribofuranose 2-oxidase